MRLECSFALFTDLPGLYFFFGAGFAAGGGAAGAALDGAFGASVCFAAPPMMSRRLSPFLPCFTSVPILTLIPLHSFKRTFSPSLSHPVPNFALKAANLPASSSSTLSSF